MFSGPSRISLIHEQFYGEKKRFTCTDPFTSPKVVHKKQKEKRGPIIVTYVLKATLKFIF